MFDIGFSELVLTALVALIVFGPERLPQAARTAGLWIGRFKRVLADTRREVERELGADDIRRQLHNEAIMKSLQESPQAIERVLKDEVMVEPEKNSTADENGKSAP
ncbi:MAG TPA: Sec-independent protein translocase protein TatB [Pseudomonadales bacterium]|jgi:sec-independent protein translocase protein TatB|nr:Sec-independent protein translocase protein TatB [Pseudomonadales bacterium]